MEETPWEVCSTCPGVAHECERLPFDDFLLFQHATYVDVRPHSHFHLQAGVAVSMREMHRWTASWVSCNWFLVNRGVTSAARVVLAFGLGVLTLGSSGASWSQQTLKVSLGISKAFLGPRREALSSIWSHTSMTVSNRNWIPDSSWNFCSLLGGPVSFFLSASLCAVPQPSAT